MLCRIGSLVSSGGGGINGQVEQRGLPTRGGGFFPPLFISFFSLALIRQRWHKFKAGCKTRTNYNQRRKKRKCLI